MSLESLEKKLARAGQKKSKKGKRATSKEKIFKEQGKETAERETITIEKGTSVGVIIGIIVTLALVAIGSVAGVVAWRLNNTVVAVDIETSLPEEIYRGVPFEMTVKIANETEDFLENAVLHLKTPTDVSVLTTLPNQGVLVSEEIGDLGSGSITQKTFSVIALGTEGESAHITVSVEYDIGKSKFETERKQDIAALKTPLSFSVTRPDHVVQGSEFEFEIVYKNISTFDFPEVVFEAQYPASFQFQSASLTPDSLNNYWKLGALNHGSEGKLTIHGILDGAGVSPPAFSIVASAIFLGKPYPIAEKNIELTLAPSPINLEIAVNRNPNYIARIGDRLVYTVQYQNRSGIALADVILKADLVGELFDFSSTQTSGFINPVTHQITWNADRVPSLRLLDPGASGEVNLEIRLKPVFPIERLSDKDFSVQLRVRAESPSVPYYLSASRTSAATFTETKVSGLMFLDTQVLYRDAGSGMVNAGTVPPRVGEPTQYTIRWIVRNYATDAKDVVIEARLEEGVRWTGMVKSNTESIPLFDEESRKVTWTLDTVPATQGVISDPLEAVFQIELVPTNMWVGQFQPLIGTSKLVAVDLFTGLNLVSGDIAITTAIPDDKTVGQAGGRIVP